MNVHHTLLSLFVLLLFSHATLAQDAPDRSKDLEYLGNPIKTYYDNPDEKDILYQLLAYDGKLYLGHGSTNASQRSKVIYYDPARNTFDVERQDGKVLEIDEEALNGMRIFDGDLYISSYDPMHSGSHLIRKRNGNWDIKNIGPDAHNRDTYRFKDKIFITHGRNFINFPAIMVSEDDGKSWTLIQQPGIVSRLSSYNDFFEFDGTLYTTTVGAPYMIKYTGKKDEPFVPVYWARNEIISRSTYNALITDATTFKGKLFFKSNGLYEATSIEPARIKRIDLPGQSGYTIEEITLTKSGIYVLATQGSRSSTRHVVNRSTDGTTWEAVLRFDHNDRLNKFEILNGDFYFGTKGKVWRLRVSGSSAPKSKNEAPKASLDVSKKRGEAPLGVSFDGRSSEDPDGTVTNYTWNFGDGSKATGRRASHTYKDPGTYTVRLTVTDDDGATASATSTIQVVTTPERKPGPGKSPVDDSGDGSLGGIGEAGTRTVLQTGPDQWHRVELKGSYTNPVVIMQPPSKNGSDPAVVRVRNAGSRSFEFQLSEWSYLDGWHTSESVGYLVLEAGRHVLEDGTVVQAGLSEAGAKATTVNYAEGFAKAPVVLAQVMSEHSGRAVVTRPQAVQAGSFQVSVQGEQALGAPRPEQIGWVAIEAGSGSTDGRRFAVSRAELDHEWEQVSFGTSFASAPVVLASTQTVHGSDPIGLRYEKVTTRGVTVQLQEEQSKNGETWHLAETVGFWAIDPGTIAATGSASASQQAVTADLNAETEALAVEEASAAVPSSFELEGNYPNPFNPSTMIRYGLPEQAPVQIEVFDTVGRRVAVLVDGVQQAGYHEVQFDASELSSGMYLYRLRSGSFVQTGKMVLMK